MKFIEVNTEHSIFRIMTFKIEKTNNVLKGAGYETPGAIFMGEINGPILSDPFKQENKFLRDIHLKLKKCWNDLDDGEVIMLKEM